MPARHICDTAEPRSALSHPKTARCGASRVGDSVARWSGREGGGESRAGPFAARGSRQAAFLVHPFCGWAGDAEIGAHSGLTKHCASACQDCGAVGNDGRALDRLSATARTDQVERSPLNELPPSNTAQQKRLKAFVVSEHRAGESDALLYMSVTYSTLQAERSALKDEAPWNTAVKTMTQLQQTFLFQLFPSSSEVQRRMGNVLIPMVVTERTSQADISALKAEAP